MPSVGLASRLRSRSEHDACDQRGSTKKTQPRDSQTQILTTRATEDVAERIVEKLLHELRLQATSLLEEGGDGRDLSRYSFITLHLDFVDANRYDGDEDDVWAPVPADGVPIAAQAKIRPRWEWRHP